MDEERELEDPDGLRLRLYPGDQPSLRDVVALGNPDLYAGLFAEDAPLTFGEPVDEPALVGAGITHHVAWRVRGDAELEAWRVRLAELGLRPTAAQERKYFRSVYFRMPDGILVELATDGPASSSTSLARRSARGCRCPPWLESERTTLERELAPLA